jgi:hypothetical protein
MSDFEFVLQSFHMLKNYFLLKGYSKVPADRRLDKQCEKIKDMFNKLVSDVEKSAPTWKNMPLKSIEQDQDYYKLAQVIKSDLARGVPLRSTWSAFAMTKPTERQQTTFTFATLVAIARLNAII